MSMFENPSAGKFGPPPENERRERELERRGKPRFGTPKEWLVVILSLGYLIIKIAFRPRGGWTVAIVALLGVILLVAQYVVGRQVRDEQGGPEPYSSPTRITR
jgi:hypothetical protein